MQENKSNPRQSVEIHGRTMSKEQAERYGYKYVEGLGWVHPNDPQDHKRIEAWWGRYADYM